MKTVKSLIIELLNYNMNAKVGIISNNTEYDFSLTFGSSEGVVKENCDTVSFYVDKTCSNEKEN